jgi:putative ABC transport system permease protein
VLSTPRPVFWCSQAGNIYPASPLANGTPPPLMLMDRATFESVAAQMKMANTDISWDYRLRPGLTLDEGSAAVKALATYGHDVLFAELGPNQAQAGANFLPLNALDTSSDLPLIHERSVQIVERLRTSILPVSLAGTLVALLLVAAAGSYWADRRRLELRLLAAKGAGPAALGVKAVFEMALPSLLGGLAGWGLACVLVRWVGPSALVDADAVLRALTLTLVAIAGGVAGLGLLAGWQSRTAADTRLPASGPAAGLGRHIPWELAVLGLAALALWRLQGKGLTSGAGTGPQGVDLLALAFPLLFLAGAVRLVTWPLGQVFDRLRTAGQGWPHALYLAARRLAGSARPAMVLFGAAALSVGVAVYAAALTRSADATLDAKAKVFVGSDTAIPILATATPPPGLDATVVARVARATATDDDGDRFDLDVLGVDPATFAKGAFWDSSFSDQSLDELLGRLGPAGADGAVPAIVAGGDLADGTTLNLRGRAGQSAAELPVHPVARAGSFPGQRSLSVLVVVDRAVLDTTQAGVENQLWAKGDPDEVAAEVRRSSVPAASFSVDVTKVLDVSSFLTTTWTFGYLQALGALTGSIAIGGLLLYVETRSRARRVSYALSRRMGLSRRAHAASLVAELALPLVGGLVAGAALAMAAVTMVYGELDGQPNLPPPPLLRVPWPVLAGAGLTVVAVTLLAAGVAQRSADRAKVGEVLRVAE